MAIDWHKVRPRLKTAALKHIQFSQQVSKFAQRMVDHHVWFVLSGHPRLEVEGHTVVLGPGSAMWLRPGTDRKSTRLNSSHYS